MMGKGKYGFERIEGAEVMVAVGAEVVVVVREFMEVAVAVVEPITTPPPPPVDVPVCRLIEPVHNAPKSQS
jgi:hypothetical protein